MTLVVWPNDIGFCLAEGFEETFPDLVERSEVDSGPAKQRRVTTSAPGLVTVAYKFTTPQRKWFRDFYNGPAAGGAIWFEWTHPVELEPWLARFIKGQPPKYQPLKPDWIATMQLEIINPW